MMDKYLNKRGFSLVELLCIIVILAVLILLAVYAVIPAMSKAEKKRMVEDTIPIIEAAQTLYVREKLTADKCYSLEEILKETGLKKEDKNYVGSVGIYVSENGDTTSKIWLSNGSYLVDGVSYEVTKDDVLSSHDQASTTCGVK